MQILFWIHELQRDVETMLFAGLIHQQMVGWAVVLENWVWGLSPARHVYLILLTYN